MNDSEFYWYLYLKYLTKLLALSEIYDKVHTNFKSWFEYLAFKTTLTTILKTLEFCVAITIWVSLRS